MALPFKLIYTDDYYLPLGAHVFPGEKYRLISRSLRENGVAAEADFVEPHAAADDDVRLVHTAEYVRKLRTGTLSLREQMQLEVPYSADLVRAFWLSGGGSILASRHALDNGCAVNLGGGFHHAYPDHGEGFCAIHDVAVAIRVMQREGKIKTAMVVDCDVHHGNGTAAIFPPASEQAAMRVVSQGHERAARAMSAEANDVCTVSLHQYNNYPAFKPPSCIDVHFADGVDDDAYLWWLERALEHAFAAFKPELLCYIAGADPYREDQLGGLALTIEGLKERDRRVLRRAKEKSVPVMVTYAGGYARRVQDTVTIHANTVSAAAEIFGIGRRGEPSPRSC